MVESTANSSTTAEVLRPRSFTLEYDHGTFYQDDDNLSHATEQIEASSPEEAAIRAIRKLYNVEFEGEMTRFNPTTVKLNIYEDQNAANLVDPFSLVPNWQEVIKFVQMGHRLGLEPKADFEKRLAEFLARQPKR